MWLSWHGTNLYAASSALATNWLARSQEDVKGHGMAVGRGVYTAAEWSKAVQYGTPHALPGVNVLMRVVLLVLASALRAWHSYLHGQGCKP